MGALKLLFLFVLADLLLDVYAQRDKKFFRNDYTYVDQTESFYKIHTIHRNWKDARRTCILEGATLFYPEDEQEANEVVKMMNDTTPFHWLYIGLSDVLAKGVFVTVDGVPATDVYNKWASGEPNSLHAENCAVLRREGNLRDLDCTRSFPFACKKELITLEWNEDCNMPNTDYKYDEGLGKCYKFHLVPKNWSDAYAACSAEQSYLAIINSQAEANKLVNMTAEAPKDNVQGDYLRGAVHLGFHDRDDDGWQTIKGTPLADSGYSNWGYTQPDGRGEEKCGSMFYTGELNDIGCGTRMFFICEHDIETPNESYDLRTNFVDT